MMRLLALAVPVALAGLLVGAPAASAQERMLAHDVYISLKDNSPQGKAKLIAACQTYLTGHPGTVWFAVGPLADELKRSVNDLDFDVALHIVFQNKAAHDLYQNAERHNQFVKECEASWTKVRVFDSYVEPSATGASAAGRSDAQTPRP